jgi:hypothetical protein
LTTVFPQCGILFIGVCGKDKARIDALQSLGFRVDESADVPPVDTIAPYHAVIVRARESHRLTVIGTRLRARPHFGRRVLLALVGGDVSERECRDATLTGFDQILSETCTARDIAAQILRLLRAYPEYRCLLRAPKGRRKAA